MNTYINVPTEFSEFATGEVKDFLLDLVKNQYDNIPTDFQCRKKELCEAILAANTRDGSKDAIREAVLDRIRTAAPSRLNLEKYGFSVKQDKHWKLKWHGKPYGLIISSSPSDRRSMRNLLSEADKKFF